MKTTLPKKLLFPLLAVALTLPFAHAQPCVPSSTAPVADGGVPGVAWYYLTQSCLIEMEGCDFHGSSPQGFWVYEETNGIEGLQRGDDVHDDTCGGRIPRDTVVF